MPEQIVNQVKNARGVERVGDDKYNGRDVTKYRYGAVANTQTNAGQVTTESFLYVDKETGLPLRSELNKTGAGSANSRVVVELRDVKLSPDRSQFDVPAGMRKISQQEAKPQLEAVASALRPFADLISGVR